MSVTATDLFCGAGGSSLGFELAGGTLRLGLNHWQRAIETHSENFQHADHECEDIASLTTNRIRRYPDSDILLASPECTNHSLAKGARRQKPQRSSLFDDGPAGDDEQERSRATMWDVVRFAEQKRLKGRPYKAIVVENVVDAYKWGYGDDGGLFQAWLQAMLALGYTHEIVWLNSMFCPPTPQSRDRMYVVFWLRTLRAPNLDFEPIAWCPSCETVVHGRQRWKRVDRPRWGRYGVQYLYACPTCKGTVLPGAAPAASIIDRTLPIERIGDRKPTKCRKCGQHHPLACNTRDRIGRGLTRLESEPFAIRLLQGGQPKPLTLPIVTLTQRHDMAMVMPVAGNTYERTPGNRARDSRRQPLDTIHGTLDRAMVVPPMGAVELRPAATAPAPTQTTTTRAAIVTGAPAMTYCSECATYDPRGAAPGPWHSPHCSMYEDPALVMGNRMHGVPRSAHDEPSQTACTGETLAVVELQNNGGARHPEDPVHTMRAGGYHHAVVLANYSPGWARRADDEAMGSVTTKDGHALIVPYDRTGVAGIADREPVQTLTTRDRAAVVWTEAAIDDCGFRMFALHEIAGAMVMADHTDGSEYQVLGNKRERMAQYGNAVTPPVMAAIVERLLPILDER
jgi:DNA (cytosine-5)-methyltransferase 1